MLRVAITGGLCSGKSTVSEFFREWGWTLIDADQVGHRLLEPGQPSVGEIVACFGADVLGPNGGVDRGKLAGRVFVPGGYAARQQLNHILHPKIIGAIAAAFDKAEGAGQTVAAAEATLIYEESLQDEFDQVIVVTCPEEEKLRRFVSERHGTREQAAARLAAQLPDAEKAPLGDWVIDNGGTLAQLRQQAENVYKQVKESL